MREENNENTHFETIYSIYRFFVSTKLNIAHDLSKKISRKVVLWCDKCINNKKIALAKKKVMQTSVSLQFYTESIKKLQFF